MAEQNFERKLLRCPKCQSTRVMIQELREMFVNPHPPAMPIYNANVQERIMCADCGVEIWPKAWVEPKTEKRN